MISHTDPQRLGCRCDQATATWLRNRRHGKPHRFPTPWVPQRSSYGHLAPDSPPWKAIQILHALNAAAIKLRPHGPGLAAIETKPPSPAVSASKEKTSRTTQRALFLNNLKNLVPQLVSSGSIPELWQSLTSILGDDSFTDGNEKQRWTTFYAPGSRFGKRPRPSGNAFSSFARRPWPPPGWITRRKQF